MKKGFTLVELLAVIVIIALISILAFPSILNQFTKSKGTVNETAKETYVNATELYLDNNTDKYDIFKNYKKSIKKNNNEKNKIYLNI